MTDSLAELRSLEKRVKTWELYLTGATYRAIAPQVGISQAQVGVYIKQTMDELAEQRRVLGMEYVHAELERLDQMLENIKERLTDSKDIDAKNLAIRIMERRSKFLGLDAPEKKEVKGSMTLEKLIMRPEDVPEEPDES